MISIETLEHVARQLEAYRGNGRGAVLFDTRDSGNYNTYNWNETVEMLRSADPTGLAEGLLLNEMIEATINGSQVRLSRVLREEGFVDSLRDILAIKDSLEEEIAWPAITFAERITAALAAVSEGFGTPTSREIAICLRDAIYCMSKGLKLRWLVCDTPTTTGRAPLSPVLAQYPDIAAFQAALRHELPFGAHLARIGADATAIGIKQPGRIAYLSSLVIDVHSGAMRQERAYGYNMSDALDLNIAVQRYPEWAPYRPSGISGSSLDVEALARARNRHEIDHITKLPRDRLLWLALVVEMAVQQMDAQEVGSVELVESLGLALPGAAESKRLPVLWSPNWHVTELALEDMFQALELSDWEKSFLRPALEGLTAADFLPLGDKRKGITFDTRELIDWPAEFTGFAADELRRRSVEIGAVSESLVGSKAEIDAARRSRFGANLATWLLEWGNREFEAQAEASLEWFVNALKSNMPRALTARCATLKGPDFRAYCDANLYSQSPKHKQYNPRCVFNAKHAVTDVAVFVPANSADIVEVLGLRSEAALPAFLRGWQRDNGWTSHEADRRGTTSAPPFYCTKRWRFADTLRGEIRASTLCAKVQFNRDNLAAVGLQITDGRIVAR